MTLATFPTRPLLVRPRLSILVGIPGSGKSTWAASMGLGAIVSSDAIREELYGNANEQGGADRVFDLFHQRIAGELRDGQPVVADSTALHAFARKKLVEIGRQHGAAIHLILFSNLNQAIRRNKERDRVVPDDAMRRMVGLYERTMGEIAREGYDSITEIRRVY
jgi:predicted kinase